jgi:hypothetical protein
MSFMTSSPLRIGASGLRSSCQGHQEFALAAVDGSQVLRQQLQVALGFAFLMHVHDGTDEAARQVVPGRQGRARIDHPAIAAIAWRSR